MGWGSRSSKREVYINICIPQERRKNSKQPKLTCKPTTEIQKKKKNKQKKNPKKPEDRRKEDIKIRAEMNEIEIKKKIEKINENKSCFSEKINTIDKLLTRLIKKCKEHK